MYSAKVGSGVDAGILGQCILQLLGGRRVHLWWLEVGEEVVAFRGLDGRLSRVDQVAATTSGKHGRLQFDTLLFEGGCPAKTVLGSVSATRPLTPALFMASATGATFVLPNGKLSLRYPDLMPCASADAADALAAAAELGEMGSPTDPRLVTC